MKIKISEKIFCIPPYLSTTWDKVAFLQSQRDPDSECYNLSIHLLDGHVVTINHLDATIVDIAFSAHVQYLQDSTSKPPESTHPTGNPLFGLFNLQEGINGLPIRFNFSSPGANEGHDMVFQHNANQANSPALPQDLLEKIAKMAHIFSGGDFSNFPKPEAHCNCPHCQIARTIHKDESEQLSEELVSEEDLQFRNWDISQIGEKLYLVKNPIDLKEQYSVYLGEPIGCTCGQKHCEHIRAVLVT